MRTRLLFVVSGMIFLLVAAFGLPADEVNMQNGERFSGNVLSVSADKVVLDSETLGKISLPRDKVASLIFGTNNIASAVYKTPPVSLPTNLPPGAALIGPAKTNADMSTSLPAPVADTNFIRQIRAQMLGGSPEAASKYDELVSGLMSGNLNLNDLRREAKSSVDQLRELKRELGPEAGDSLDGYLGILDNFLKETADEPTNAASVHVQH